MNSASRTGIVTVESQEQRERFGALGENIRAMRLAEEEYYNSHPCRRFLKKLGLIRVPDFKARRWALKKIGASDAAKRLD